MADEKTHDLYDLMSQASKEMAAEYHRIRRRANEEPGTAGDQGEENWAELLRNWLPPTYQVVTKGRIISEDGRTTPQIDVIVLKDIYPKKLLSKKHYLAGGVAAAFECKATLRAFHINAAVRTCKVLKDFYRIREGSPYRELHSPILYGLLSHSHSWKSKKSNPVINVTGNLDKSDASHIVHPRHSLDLLCVADLGIWASSKITLAEQPSNRNGTARSAYVASSIGNDTKKARFTPIGSFISFLIMKLAREDPRLRDIADYYRLTGLLGSGEGRMREWPTSIYSEKVRSRVEAGILTNGEWWDEWSVGFL